MDEYARSALRLSVSRAFLGRVHASMRLIKATRAGDAIRLTVILDRLSKKVRDDISEAATEVISDFPVCSIEEVVLVNADALPVEDVIAEGWVHARAE
jgi:hypothetical protein